ncbi:hypothetical protein ZYGM_001518 [Zygosaccharomyces mellis]|uniref:SRP9 domain-containing protein n=1 Tax=Zygosaccharomyces mellis TaxID=42258 RepID=A0A4C2E583_9SACH|nr:hypothetical protein ZYGM_001518 [Zygosaccharomyces mellis]
MSVKPIDSFISQSVGLFEANPSQTTFAISYKNRLPSQLPQVSFKTHNPHLNCHYKFETCKSKDVSRLLSALGPRGVTVTLGKVERSRKQKKLPKRHRKQSKVKDVVGLSTLMVNTDVKEYVPPAAQEVGGASTKTDAKKKKSKSKNKKKR